MIFIFLSIDGSLISVGDYFVFKYVTLVLVSCWPCDVPMLVEYAPSNFTPAEVGEVKLNWVVP